MAERAITHQLAPIARIAAVAIPPECSPRPIDITRPNHFLERGLAQNLHAAAPAFLQHHLAVDREVLRRAEEARMSGDALECVRSRIMHVTFDPLVVALLRGLRALLQFIRWVVTRLVHAE